MEQNGWQMLGALFKLDAFWFKQKWLKMCPNAIMLRTYLEDGSFGMTENQHHMGKYHCAAGLQFDESWIPKLRFMQSNQIGDLGPYSQNLYSGKKVKQKLSIS